MPPDSKTKIRPQQSCLRCRERKVKVPGPGYCSMPRHSHITISTPKKKKIYSPATNHPFLITSATALSHVTPV